MMHGEEGGGTLSNVRPVRQSINHIFESVVSDKPSLESYKYEKNNVKM